MTDGNPRSYSLGMDPKLILDALKWIMLIKGIADTAWTHVMLNIIQKTWKYCCILYVY